MWDEPVAAEASMTLQKPEAHCVFSSREVVPGSHDPGSGGLHRLAGGSGGGWIVTCACTQASWRLQQQC